MPRYVALLRGLNVGGHRIKMTELKRHFEALGFDQVTTVIASGNVLFHAASGHEDALARRIEEHLARALGYEVATFLRTPAEMPEIAARQPFSAADMAAPTHSIHVIFFGSPVGTAARRELATLRTRVDEFVAYGREVYWLCRGKISVDSLAAPLLAKATKGPPSTMRNLTTVRRLADLLAAAPPAPTRPPARSVAKRK